MEMPGPISGWQRDGRRFTRRQHALLILELPDEDFIQPQVRMQYEAPGRIGLNHVRMSPIMSAEGGAARWSIGRLGGADLSRIVLDIGGGTQTTVRKNRQHRHGTSKIVGHQQKPSG